MAKEKIDFTKQPDLGATATSDMSTPEKIKYQVQSADKEEKKKKEPEKKKSESKPEKKITTELNATTEEHEKAKKDTMVREGYGEKPAEEKPLKTDLNSQLDEKASEIGISLTPEIKNSDEVQYAIDAIEKDPSKLSDLSTPSGERLFNIEYDQNGNAFAAQIPEISKPALESKGAAALLTITSILLSITTGGLFPPINFGELLGTNEYWEKVDAANKAVADIANKGYEQNLMNQVQNAQTQAEMNLAEANKEKIPALGQMKEAMGGATSFQQAELSANLQKQLQKAEIDFKKYNLEQTKELAKLAAELDAKRIPMQIEACRKAGISDDDIAKFVGANGGKTTINRVMEYINQGTDAVGNVAGAVGKAVGAATGTGNSDKNIKTFDAKKPNSSMLKKAFKWR